MTIDFESFTPELLRRHPTEKWSRPGIGAWVAEMDFGVPPAVAEVLRAVVDAGALAYPTDRQLAEARAATTRWLARTSGWETDPGQVQLVADVLTALAATLEHLVEPGAPVILPVPNYMPFLTLPEVFGHPVLRVPGTSTPRGRHAMDLEGIDAAFRAGGRLLILCNPHNPVGRVYDREELLALAAVVDAHGGRVFSDEIHAPLVLEPTCRHVPYASLDRRTAAHSVTALAASKGWNIPGLKCAQLILTNDDDARRLAPFSPFLAHQASTPGLLATAAAYDRCDAWLAEVVAHLRANAARLGELVAENLPGVGYHEPEGTYLAWLDTRALPVDNPSRFFAERAGVVTTDGASCGAPGFVRFNLAMARGTLERALRQMGDALAAR